MYIFEMFYNFYLYNYLKRVIYFKIFNEYYYLIIDILLLVNYI